MEQVERWWNGRWGRLARRDLWLYRDDARWRLEARQGDGDARRWGRDYPDEGSARAELEAMKARGSDEWRNLA